MSHKQTHELPEQAPTPRRIALSFPGCHRKGGVERVMLECANFLAERGHETHVFASDWDIEALNNRVVRHDVTTSTRSARLWRWNSPTSRIPRFIRASGEQIEQMRPPPQSIGSFGIFAPADGVVWMQSVHRAWIEISHSQRDFKGRLKQRLNPFHGQVLRLEEQQLRGRNYAHVVALTDEVKRDIMRLYDVPDADITVINNGYAPLEFNVQHRETERAKMRQKLGYTPDDKVVVFVANELERKGFPTLLEAIAGLKDKHVKLLAVGRLSAAACSEQIARLQMRERVHFTGPSSNVAQYYAASDVFALPTQYEAWGLVITEAMACGLPALTSRLAGAAVAIRTGENGALLDNPRDVDETRAQLKSLLDGAHGSPQEVSNSVVEYSWPRLLPRYEEVLLRYGTNR